MDVINHLIHWLKIQLEEPDVEHPLLAERAQRNKTLAFEPKPIYVSGTYEMALEYLGAEQAITSEEEAALVA